MSNLAETKEYKGYTINIYYDEEPLNPRKDFDNLGVIFSNHRNYNPDGRFFEELIQGQHTYNFKTLENYLNKIYYWLKVRGYEHSGFTISTSNGYPYNDPWDSGLFGIIAIEKEVAYNQWGKSNKTKSLALKCLQGEVETLDMYYRGEVFGYSITDKLGNEIDSMWGIFGLEYAIQEATDFIDNL